MKGDQIMLRYDFGSGETPYIEVHSYHCSICGVPTDHGATYSINEQPEHIRDAIECAESCDYCWDWATNYVIALNP